LKPFEKIGFQKFVQDKTEHLPEISTADIGEKQSVNVE